MYPTIREKKKNLVATPPLVVSSESSYFSIHGIDCEFVYGSSSLKTWIEKILESYHIKPKLSLKPEVQIKWLTPVGLSASELELFNEDPDPELEIIKLDKSEMALQRDFSGHFESNMVTIYCRPDFDDGFYNALRWCLPRFLLQRNAIMLHSSCMVDHKGRAHLFIGQSGVGKTTTVSRISNRIILGDDMILVSLDQGQVFAETPVLGQNPKFKGSTGQKYPVGSLNFLSQGDQVSKLKTSPLEATKKLYMSLMYPTWNWASPNEVSLISKLAQGLIAATPTWNLTLDLDTEFLGVVDGTI